MSKIKNKFVYFITLIFIIFFMNPILYAVEDSFDFSEIELITECNLDTFLEEDFNIEGHYAIKINFDEFEDNIRLKKMELGFQAFDPESREIMNKNLKIQYRLVQASGSDSQWSNWIPLSQLPVIINLVKIERATLYIKFMVPQSLYIREGFYNGRFYVNLI